MKRNYTINIHADRLRRMLCREKPCGHCPAAPFFNASRPVFDLWQDPFVDNSKANHPCQICRKFVGASPGRFDQCPCYVLGPKEAIRRAHKALKKHYKNQD